MFHIISLKFIIQAIAVGRMKITQAALFDFLTKLRIFFSTRYSLVLVCWTTLSGDLSSSGFDDPLLEASSLDSFRADLGESGKGI